MLKKLCENLHLPIKNKTIVYPIEGLSEKDYCQTCLNRNLIKVRVEGLIISIAFQKARLYAEKLNYHLPSKFAVPQIREMLQVDWHEYLQKMKVKVGGKMWSLNGDVAVFINDVLIGSEIEFFHYINKYYIFNLPVDLNYYETLIADQYRIFLQKSKRIYTYFTFTVDGVMIGSLLFMLYSDLLPQTCKYFLRLCTGKDENMQTGTNSLYINTSVQRIVKGGWIQLGYIEVSNCDIFYESTTIPDESYCIPHNRRGVLSMVNNGKHCNGSQFSICLKPNPWMDHHYVAFGQLVDGVRTLKKLEEATTYYECPITKIIISQCGEYYFGDKIKMEAETDVFLDHYAQLSAEDDSVIFDYTNDKYSDVIPWLDNIVDEIDIRDVPSIFMAEQHLNELCNISTDFLLGTDVLSLKNQIDIETKSNMVCSPNICELLTNFQPCTMSEEEKISFIKKISLIILKYILTSINDQVSSEHYLCYLKAINDYKTIQKILENAYEITRMIVAKAVKKDLHFTKINTDMRKCTKMTKCEDIILDNYLLFIENILNKSIHFTMKSLQKC